MAETLAIQVSREVLEPTLDWYQHAYTLDELENLLNAGGPIFLEVRQNWKYALMQRKN